MYDRDQAKLSALGRSGPDGFERICTFVLLTIRVPLYAAAADYKLLRNGDTSVRSLFGAKHSGLAYVRAHSAELLEGCEYAYETCNDVDAANVIVGVLCDIPNIGPAKAGFICQMIYGLSGCIDTHNLTRFDLREREFRMDRDLSARAKAKVVTRYNDFCRRAGGARALWDGWCEYVHANQPINYPSAEYVSALHTVPLRA